MAEDKGKKKGKSKKGKPEPRNWTKIGLQVLIVAIMVMSVLAFTLNINRGGNSDNEASSNERSFNGMAEALKLIPSGAGFARYADLKNDTVLSGVVDNYIWLKGSLPPRTVFDADPQRDLFAIYPSQYFSTSASQVVSLTDFGTPDINVSYPDSTGTDYSHRLLSSIDIVPKKVTLPNVNNYYFTPSTVPVVSGALDNIAPAAYVMMTGNTSMSSYSQYSDLLDESRSKNIMAGSPTFEVVGENNNVSKIINSSVESDRYYAALAPLDKENNSADRPYYYVYILHINQTLTNEDAQNLFSYSEYMDHLGFERYDWLVDQDYLIIEAQGSLEMCLNDMQQMEFIKYQASL